MGIIITILVLCVFFKLTGLMFRALGHIFGFILGICCYLFLGFLAVSLLGLAVSAVPVIIAAGIIALIVGAVRN